MEYCKVVWNIVQLCATYFTKTIPLKLKLFIIIIIIIYS